MDNKELYTDKQLFRLIAEGNERAFSVCVHRFTPHLYPYINSIVQAEFWAEDILQDLYIRLWKNKAKLSAIENPGGYLNRMASNMALDFLKHRSVEVKAQYRIEREMAVTSANPNQGGGGI